tara:strand:- start:137 stop:946 length:810 start_codon:yes stop_codon:yes gene_type:complete
MSFEVLEIGKTGPAGRIGDGTEYHIDTKFGKQLSFDEIRKRFDALARRYGLDGRSIEFSNAGVANQIYDLTKTPAERISLLQRAAAAHGSKYPDFHSFDYYAPNKGVNRWDKSAEGAPIYVVGAAGSKVQGGSGGGYGNYGFVLDKDGNVISKSGHGDNRLSQVSSTTLGPGMPTLNYEFDEDGNVVAANVEPPDTTTTTDPQTGDVYNVTVEAPEQEKKSMSENLVDSLKGLLMQQAMSKSTNGYDPMAILRQYGYLQPTSYLNSVYQ